MSRDPLTFLQATTQSLGIEQGSDPWTDTNAVLRAWSHAELTERQITSHLDALVSFAGCWETAGEIASQIVSCSRPVETSLLQTYVACALAARRDARCLRAFDDVASRSDACPFDTAMSQVRAAAWLVKRGNDIRGAANRLSCLEVLVDRWRHQSVISEADADAMQGVAANLFALVDLKSGNPQAAQQHLRRAVSLLAGQGLVTVAPDRRARYAAQARLNCLQLRASTSGWRVASVQALEHVEWCQTHHDGSVSEAMAIAAYALLRGGDHTSATRLARRTAHVIAREGSPTRLSAVRKTLVGALHASGRDDEAMRHLERLTADPLGLSLADEGAGE